MELFLSQSADIVMAADFDGFPDFWKEPWFPPVYPCPDVWDFVSCVLCSPLVSGAWMCSEWPVIGREALVL